jgi:hypothetical protein
MRINLQTAVLIDVHKSDVGRMNSGPALTSRAIELLKHQAAKQPSRVRIPSEVPNNCRTAFNHDPSMSQNPIGPIIFSLCKAIFINLELDLQIKAYKGRGEMVESTSAILQSDIIFRVL